MIRKMQESDWADVKRIYTEGIENGGSTFNVKCPSYEEWDGDHLKDCRLVFELESRVVGFAVLAPTSKRECYKGVVEVSIFIENESHGKGIGTALLKKLMSEAEQHGYWTLFSVILSPNTASIKLHKKCGFRVIGTRERVAKDKFGNWQSTTIMEWRNSIS